MKPHGKLPKILFLWAFLLSQAKAGDWPAFKHDNRRTATSTEALHFPLSQTWADQSAQPPSPAWPPPHFLLLNRLDFDYAPQPVVADGRVFFGSTSDDTIRALDLATGRQLWQFPTGGPIRIAPQAEGGMLYCASDDGHAYCMEASTGKLAWEFDASPSPELAIGNGRMVSRWPVRTGVLVENGTAYLAAGIWASEGVFVYALDAKTGKVLWCNDTSGYAGVDYNTLLTLENRSLMRHGTHDGDFGYYGLTPQGALAITEEVLLVPNGYNSTSGIDRKSGKLLFADPQAGRGGTWIHAGKKDFHTIYKHRNNKILLMKCDARTGERIQFHHYGIRNLTTLPPRPSDTGQFHEPGQTQILVTEGTPVSRNAYSLVKAGPNLISGQDGHVLATDLEGEEVWRAPVNGKAYGLAVADGHLIVTTDTGAVHCFGNTPKNPTPAPEKQVVQPTALPLVQKLREANMDKGFALVIGDADARASLSIAANTQLKVILLPAEGQDIQALRHQLLSQTSLYGSKVHIPNHADIEALPDYFANAILLAGQTKADPQQLFRILRPCGGILTHTPEGQGAFLTAKASLSQSIPKEEASITADSILRHRLPGAHDWDSKDDVDHRVKWPLRPLWFGGPESSQVTDNKNGHQRPLAADGRYYVMGEDNLSAIDAYNGNILWSRPLPPRSPDLTPSGGILLHTEKVWDRELRDSHRRSIRVNDKDVYLHLQEGYFQGQGPGTVILNARTGSQTDIYAPYQTPEDFLLDKPRQWKLEIDADHSGTLKITPDANGITLDLQTKDPSPTNQDGWDIFLDFRPPSQRYGLHDAQVLRLQAKPDETLKVPCPVASFGFAAILYSYDGTRGERVQRKYLFCDHTASGLNNGWANIQLDSSEPLPSKPELVKGTNNDLPKADVVAGWPKAIATEIAAMPRRHPLTLEPGPRIFRTGTGTCGGFDFSATSVVKRSGAAKVLGIYDFLDDSGLRTFVGVSAGCGPTTINSQGLLIASESKARCVCNFPFRTTLVLAPATRRLQEDWAIFYDRDVDTRVRQATLNLGAPGDRRDAHGDLWLGFPRPTGLHEALGYPNQPGTKTEAFLPGVWPIARQPGLHIPLEISHDPDGGPYRFNADRTPLSSVSRPWLYASGYQGIRKATLQLDFLKPLTARRVATPPRVDGILRPGEWPEEPQARLPHTGTSVYLAYDDKNLYLAAQNPAFAIPEAREVPPIEIFLSDTDSGKFLHLPGKGTESSFKPTGAGFSFEIQIPFSTLANSGISTTHLGINLQTNKDAKTGEALAYPAPANGSKCTNFFPLGLGTLPPEKSRHYDVTLHFAEPENLQPGTRTFGISIQGKTLRESFDPVAEAGATRKATTLSFPGIPATGSLEITFLPLSGKPLLNAIEIRESPPAE